VYILHKKILKVVFSTGLAIALTFAVAPNAEASSYYRFLQQYLNQPQQQLPSQPQPAPTPQPTTPQQPNQSNFWESRTASRNALMQKPQTPAPQQPAPQQPQQPAPTPEPAPVPQPSQLTAREQQMLNLVNTDRIAHGLSPLQADMRLTRLARIKSQDIVDNNYFAHRSPTYGTAFDMFRSENISFLRGGENLSKAGSVQISHLRLMNSPSHRANLLTPQYTHIGIGIVNNYPSGIVATQMFIQMP